jgi:uncharacterized protein (TIGR02246 family)
MSNSYLSCSWDEPMIADADTETAVLGMVKKWSDSFAKKDLEGILGLFARDDDVSMFGSWDWEVAVGPDALRTLYTRLFSGEESISWEWKSYHVSSSGTVAWVFARGFVHTRKGESDSSGAYRLTAVFEKRGGRWTWMQFHGSEPVAT